MEKSATAAAPHQGDLGQIHSDLAGILESLTVLNGRLASISDSVYGSRPTSVSNEKDSVQPDGRVAQINSQVGMINSALAATTDEVSRLESLG